MIDAYVKDIHQSNVLLTTSSHNGTLVGHELMWLKITKMVGLFYRPPKPIYDSSDFVTRFSNDVEELRLFYILPVILTNWTFQTIQRRWSTTNCAKQIVQLMLNCDISCSASNDRCLAGRRQTQFYDTRQYYVDKLALALHECDWSSVTGAAEIDYVYNTFLVDTTDHVNKIGCQQTFNQNWQTNCGLSHYATTAPKQH